MTLSPMPIRTRSRPSALAAAALLAAAPGPGHADPHTTLSGNSAGGKYIGNAGSHFSPVAQTFDIAGSQDRFIGIADYGRVGFSYAVSGVSTPPFNYSIGAYYGGSFTDTFSVASSSLPFGADALVHVHLSLKSRVAWSDDHGGQIQFRQQSYTAEADGRTLTVSQTHPTAVLDYDLHALVGYSGWQIGAGLGQAIADVTVDYSVPQAQSFSATWDLLPADGYGLRYTVSADPGVSLTFASGHNYAAAVPEPGSAMLLLAGLTGIGLSGTARVARRRGES
jgi:hypothetical protein